MISKRDAPIALGFLIGSLGLGCDTGSPPKTVPITIGAKNGRAILTIDKLTVAFVEVSEVSEFEFPGELVVPAPRLEGGATQSFNGGKLKGELKYEHGDGVGTITVRFETPIQKEYSVQLREGPEVAYKGSAHRVDSKYLIVIGKPGSSASNPSQQ